MTNVETRSLAVRIALITNDRALVADVARQLAGTERNIVLRKDETTVELERARLERERITELLSAALELTKHKAAPGNSYTA
jgi:hypothetical protein